MTDFGAEGGCACGTARYHVRGTPLIVHCCHCSLCQRQTGSAFAVNAMIESRLVELVTGETETVGVPTPSGRGQDIVRCPTCRVALWSHYGASGRAIAFLRVGTLDEQDRMPPDVHIYTSTRRPWVLLGDGVPVHEEFYDPGATWSGEAMKRYRAARSSAS